MSNLKFFYRDGIIYAQEAGQCAEAIITRPTYMRQETQVAGCGYLARVTNELNTMEPFSDAMTIKLEEIEQVLRQASIAETSCRDAEFPA